MLGSAPANVKRANTPLFRRALTFWYRTASVLYITFEGAVSEHALRIVVLVKQVPDTANVTGEAMKDDGTVNRAALPAIFNPEDLNALEEALRLKDRHGGRVTVLTMGPPSAASGAARVAVPRRRRGRAALRPGLRRRRHAGHELRARPGDRATGRRPTSCSAAGRRSTATRPRSARRPPRSSSLPQITCVSRIDEVVPPGDGAGEAGSITATRSVEDGTETLRAPLPALLTITGEANEPRPPSVKLVMTYKDAIAEALPGYDDSYLDPDSDDAEVCMIGRDGRPVCRAKIVLWDAASIEAERELVGLRGSPTRVKKIDSVVLAAGETRLVEPTDEGVHALVRELIEEHILG